MHDVGGVSLPRTFIARPAWTTRLLIQDSDRVQDDTNARSRCTDTAHGDVTSLGPVRQVSVGSQGRSAIQSLVRQGARMLQSGPSLVAHRTSR